MRYFLIAGDPSGDSHGAKLIKKIQQEDSEAVFRFFGGDEMEKVAGPPVVHLKDLAFMGFTQLLAYTKLIRQNFRLAKKTISQFNPDCVILIDYAGFNLRMARWVKQRDIKVYYYIPPKVWAWRRGRVKKLRSLTDHVFSVLPFEVPFLSKHKVQVSYVGSPVLEDIKEIRDQHPMQVRKDLELSDKPVIALLPGSREQEIEYMLPVMVAIPDQFPDYQFVVAAHPNFPQSFYESFDPDSKLIVRSGKTQEILRIAQLALVTSGTATLETALHGVPQVVCYRTNMLSFIIARVLIRVKFISLVNLIMGRSVLKELIQNKLNQASLVREMKKLINQEEAAEMTQLAYRELMIRLGDRCASEETARKIVNYLSPQNP